MPRAKTLFRLATGLAVPLAALIYATPVLAAIAVAPPLGAAAGFGVLGATTVTCTNASHVTGDVGVSPGTAITGFHPDCTLSGQLRANDGVAVTAQANALTAYNTLAGEACVSGSANDLTGKDLGALGQPLSPGVYCFSSSAGLTGTLTLSGAGVYVFKIGSTLTTATNSSVTLMGGAQACSVFWQVGSSATLGVGTAFAGNIVALTSITLVHGTTLAGRAIALNAAVTMDANTVSSCTTAGGGGGGGGEGNGDGEDHHGDGEDHHGDGEDHHGDGEDHHGDGGDKDHHGDGGGEGHHGDGGGEGHHGDGGSHRD